MGSGGGKAWRSQFHIVAVYGLFLSVYTVPQCDNNCRLFLCSQKSLFGVYKDWCVFLLWPASDGKLFPSNCLLLWSNSGKWKLISAPQSDCRRWNMKRGSPYNELHKSEINPKLPESGEERKLIEWQRFGNELRKKNQLNGLGFLCLSLWGCLYIDRC